MIYLPPRTASLLKLDLVDNWKELIAVTSNVEGQIGARDSAESKRMIAISPLYFAVSPLKVFKHLKA
jgi:hypothetical protein